MTLNNIPAGSKVYVDANIFIYHFTSQSNTATELLHRCEQGEVHGVTGTLVLLEVNHRLMILEALQAGLIAGNNLARRLGMNPNAVQRLVQYSVSVSKIPQMGIRVLPLDPHALDQSREYRQRDGLLTNDSIIVFEAIHCGADFVASTDAAFDRVHGIIRAYPNDVQL